nr:MAG TPA: hypothetical protein [Caudoviricetes sp.]
MRIMSRMLYAADSSGLRFLVFFGGAGSLKRGELTDLRGSRLHAWQQYLRCAAVSGCPHTTHCRIRLNREHAVHPLPTVFPSSLHRFSVLVSKRPHSPHIGSIIRFRLPLPDQPLDVPYRLAQILRAVFALPAPQVFDGVCRADRLDPAQPRRRGLQRVNALDPARRVMRRVVNIVRHGVASFLFHLNAPFESFVFPLSPSLQKSFALHPHGFRSSGWLQYSPLMPRSSQNLQSLQRTTGTTSAGGRSPTILATERHTVLDAPTAISALTFNTSTSRSASMYLLIPRHRPFVRRNRGRILATSTASFPCNHHRSKSNNACSCHLQRFPRYSHAPPAPRQRRECCGRHPPNPCSRSVQHARYLSHHPSKKQTSAPLSLFSAAHPARCIPPSSPVLFHLRKRGLHGGQHTHHGARELLPLLRIFGLCRSDPLRQLVQ